MGPVFVTAMFIALSGCDTGPHYSHEEEMEALGRLIGTTAEDAEAQVNRNTARQQAAQRRAEQDRIARQQAQQRQRQAIEDQIRNNLLSKGRIDSCKNIRDDNCICGCPNDPDCSRKGGVCTE